MEMMTTVKYYPLNSVRVCIDERNMLVASGRAYSPLSGEQIEFSDIKDLILKLDTLFDRAGYPQAFQEKRMFREGKEEHCSYKGIPTPKTDAGEILRQQGRVSTWDIQVDERRNTSWQGKVRREGAETQQAFYSELGLLELLDAM